MAKVMLKESEIVNLISEAIGEISYAMARDAFKKAGRNFDENPRLYDDPRKRKQFDNLHQHFADRSAENFDPNMPVKVCFDNGEQMFKAGDLEQYFEVSGFVEPSANPIYADQKIIGYPRLKGFIGPMSDGDKLRYETNNVYKMMST